MKINIESKKGLKTILSIIIDKKSIKKKFDEKLIKLGTEVTLKGFRPGKVPPTLIKSQFGKAIYGEVIENILKESTSTALVEKKIKVAGQPKIKINNFKEGEDLKYEIEVESFPEVKLFPLEKYNISKFEIIIEDKNITDKLVELSKNYKDFKPRTDNEKSQMQDLIIFDYKAKYNNQDFEGNTGNSVSIELGKDLFIKGFDKQLVGVTKNSNKKVKVKLPENYPKKELIGKEVIFDCNIKEIKKGEISKIDDAFAKKLGAKNLVDLKELIKKQIENEYKFSFDAIIKKEILDQVEKKHNIDLPKNLIDNELAHITQNLKKEEQTKHREKNMQVAKERIKIGLILNQYAEKNNLKISDNEINSEIQNQAKRMPGNEKMIMQFYQNNSTALQGLKGQLFETKIMELIKSKAQTKETKLNTKEALKLIQSFNSGAKTENKEKKTKNKKIK